VNYWLPGHPHVPSIHKKYLDGRLGERLQARAMVLGDDFVHLPGTFFFTGQFLQVLTSDTKPTKKKKTHKLL
jgi:hypothetical protein